MITFNNFEDSPIIIGKIGENIVTGIDIDLGGELHEGWTVRLYLRRPNEAAVYEKAGTLEGNILRIVFNSYDTEKLGTGEAALVFFGTGGEIKKSGAATTEINYTLSVNGTPPEPTVLYRTAAQQDAIDATFLRKDAQVEKTVEMTQPVGVDAVGKLWALPGGGGGTGDHTQLTNRDAANQHPISAITGLQSALDSKGTYNKPTGGIPATDLAQAVQINLEKAENALQEAVFYAQYGVTTFAQISEAYNSGKSICATYNDAQYIMIFYIPDAQSAQFMGIGLNNNIMLLSVYDNTWSSSSINLEISGNKVSVWQSTPDNTHYPSEKLVKDSLDEKIDILAQAVRTSDMTQPVGADDDGKLWVPPSGGGGTSVKVNGETFAPVDGVADIGTVIRTHQDISGKLDTTGGTMTGGLKFSFNGAYVSLNNTPVVAAFSEEVDIGHLNRPLMLRGSANRPQYKKGSEDPEDMALLADLNSKADKPIIKTVMDSVATVNTEYYLGTQSTVSITMPTDAELGQEIKVFFKSGATAATLTCDLTGFDYTPKANTAVLLTFRLVHKADAQVTGDEDEWTVQVEEG